MRILALSVFLLAACGDDDASVPSNGAAPGNGAFVTTQAQPDKCPNQRADVVVDASGKVIDVVCSPSAASVPLDAQGNATVSGNNEVIAGDGAGVSVIPGSVNAHGNNFSTRGVTVKGNVTIDGNDGSLVLSVIEGDVIVTGNNVVIAGCTVGGAIRISGNNAVLLGNKVSRGIDPGDHNATCDGNVDANGAAINCGQK